MHFRLHSVCHCMAAVTDAPDRALAVHRSQQRQHGEAWDDRYVVHACLTKQSVGACRDVATRVWLASSLMLVCTAGGRSAQFLLGDNGLDYAAMAPRLQYYYNYRQSVSKCFVCADDQPSCGRRQLTVTHGVPDGSAVCAADPGRVRPGVAAQPGLRGDAVQRESNRQPDASSRDRQPARDCAPRAQ